jgi:hypothetical protein
MYQTTSTENDCRLVYTSAMHSEILFILILIAPWALVLAAILFYRHRRIRKMLNDSGYGRNDDEEEV